MSRSADLCLYVLALQNKLLSEEELDAKLQQAVETHSSLKAVLYEESKLDPRSLERILGLRKEFARACAACRATTYVMAGQESKCEACGEALPKPQGADEPPASDEPPAPDEPPASNEPPASDAAAAAPAVPPPRRRPPPRGRPVRRRRGPPRKGPPRKGPPRRGPPGGRGGRAGRRRPMRRPAPPPLGADLGVQTDQPTSSIGQQPALDPAAEIERKLTSSDYGVSSSKKKGERPLRSGDYRASSEDARTHEADAAETKTADAEAKATAERDAKAKARRLEGGGFGYEPVDESKMLQKPKRRLGEAVVPPAPDPGGAAEDAGGSFQPPAEHMAQVTNTPPAEIPPVRRDLGRILALPIRTPEAIGALVVSSLFVLFLDWVPCWMLPVFLLTVLYPYAFLVRVTEWGANGSDEIPGWPEFNPWDLLMLGLRLAGTTLACYLPMILLLVPLTWAALAGYVGVGTAGWQTIGSKAHDMAPAEPYVAAGTHVSEVTFTRVKDDALVRLDDGNWTILGLLGKDTADDTGMTEMMQDMPVGNFGVVIMPGNQPWDLDRVGQAIPGVRVLGAYADPARKVVRSRWAYLIPPDEDEYGDDEDGDDEDGDDEDGDDEDGDGEYGDEYQEEVGEDLEAARGMAEMAGRAQGADDEYWDGEYRVDPFKKLEVVTFNGFLFPAPFDRAPRPGAIYLIDPEGKVAREYAAGVYDEKLYADLLSLKAGGRGDVSARTLPGKLSPSGMGFTGSLVTVLWLGVIALYLLGSFYWPMAWLMMSTFTSGTMPFMYGTGIKAIKAAFPDYLALTGLFIGVQVLTVLVQVWLGLFLPGWTMHLVLGFVFMYGQLVIAHGIGRLYLANRPAIGWF